jgi:hypothetical protein
VLVPDIGQVVGFVHIVPDPWVGELNVLKRLGLETRLRLVGGLPARMNGINEFEGG